MDSTVITTVLDKVSSILGSIGTPVIAITIGFALLSLFLHFRK